MTLAVVITSAPFEAAARRVDPDTGRPELGLVSYQLYLDESSVPMRVPPHLLAMPHYWIGQLR